MSPRLGRLHVAICLTESCLVANCLPYDRFELRMTFQASAATGTSPCDIRRSRDTAGTSPNPCESSCLATNVAGKNCTIPRALAQNRQCDPPPHPQTVPAPAICVQVEHAILTTSKAIDTTYYGPDCWSVSLVFSGGTGNSVCSPFGQRTLIRTACRSAPNQKTASGSIATSNFPRSIPPPFVSFRPSARP